jgi:hypothetical protein
MPTKTPANRNNALKSTRPGPPAGKAMVGRNVTKHRLLSREALLPGEDRAAFRAFAARLWEYLQPVGSLECLLADHIRGGAWRLRPVRVVEAGQSHASALEEYSMTMSRHVAGFSTWKTSPSSMAPSAAHCTPMVSSF